MNRKLVIISIFLFSVAVGFYFLDPFGTIRKKINRFDEFPMGDIYGSIRIADLRFILTSLENDSIVPYGKVQLKLIPSLLESLDENGFDVETLYLVGDFPAQTIHFLLPYSNRSKAAAFLEESAYLFDFKVDSSGPVITYDFEGLLIEKGEHWVKLSYTDTVLFKDVRSIKNRKDRLNIDVLNTPNTFFTSGAFSDSLGVTSFRFEVDAQYQRIIGNIEFHKDQPFVISSNSSAVPALGLTKEHFRIQLNQLDPSQPSILAPLFKKIREFGLNPKELSEAFTGEIIYERGEDVEIIDTIITTRFDEDFNPIEERRIRKKMQPTFLLFLGSNDPEALQKALRRNNFLRPSGNVVRMPDGKLARYTKLENGLMYSTIQLPDGAIEIKPIDAGLQMKAYKNKHWTIKWNSDKNTVHFVLELSTL